MHIFTSTMGRRTPVAVLLALTLAGCGSGEEQPSAAASAPTPTPTAAPSTALAANPVSNGFEFDQYLNYRLQLDLTPFGADLSGGLFVVKVFDDDGNSYFLGQADELAQLDLLVSLPRHINRLWLEIFTDHPQGGRILEEIVL